MEKCFEVRFVNPENMFTAFTTFTTESAKCVSDLIYQCRAQDNELTHIHIPTDEGVLCIPKKVFDQCYIDVVEKQEEKAKAPEPAEKERRSVVIDGHYVQIPTDLSDNEVTALSRQINSDFIFTEISKGKIVLMAKERMMGL